MPGYPIELNLSDKTVLVVGLGRVGRRKAESLVAAGAHVVAVDPAASGIEPIVGAEIRNVPYCAEQLHGISLVVSAAPAEVNRQVVADARAAGVWVGSASEPEMGDFKIPAIWRKGPVTLTVSTSGASPALAVVLRDRAAQAIGPAAVGLTALLEEIRPLVRARVTDPETRRRLLSEYAEPQWLDLWSSQGPEAVRRRLLERLEDAERPPY